ncbi:MAG: CoA-binding protein [Candidatus Helarchaeota archaeon]|nr:CoA-binding protein [Candidatus Helarchaeota archaeon]
MNGLEIFFNPGSVALIGASNNPKKPPYYLVKNLVDFGYKGKIYPINPNEKKIYNIPAYPSILDVKEEVELAFIVLPSQITPKITEECAKKNVKGIIIGSGRFSEKGIEGKIYIDEVLEIAKENEIRIMGPNSIGVTNPYTNFTTAFIDIPKLKKGNIALITQTGAIGGPLLHWLMPISKTICLGNMSDITISEILEYLEKDEPTHYIGIHCEQIKEPEKFRKIAGRVNKKKPIVILKTGSSKIGSEVAKSHTASLTGRDEIYKSLFQQIGLIRVSTFEEFFDTLKLINKRNYIEKGNLGFVSISGAQCVLACDLCEKYNIPIAKVSKDSSDELKKLGINNLVLLDVGSWQGEMDVEEIYRFMTELAISEPNVNYVIVFLIPTPILFYFDVPSLFSKLQQKYSNKILITCMFGEEEICLKWKKALENIGIITFPSISRALKAVSHFRF